MCDERLDARNTLCRCPRCGHLLREPERCPAGARGPAYGGDPRLDRVRLWLLARRLRRLLPRRARVYEIGYGAGLLLARLHAAGHAVAGIDSGQARLAVRTAPGAATLQHGDAASARLAEGEEPYDLVLALHVVEHLADPVAVLRAARGLLRPGGRLVLVTPGADSLGLRWFGAAWWMLEDPTHVGLFTPRSLAEACRAAGFTAVTVRRAPLDSLACEAASLRRRVAAPRAGGPGVLAERGTLALAALSLPVVLVLRLLVPRLRPALFAVAAAGADVV